MSLNKYISTFERTGRGFTINENFIHNCKGAFLTKKDFTFIDSDLDDDDYFFQAFENGDIFPLHYVNDVIINNKEINILESNQGFTFKGSKGVISHVLKFNWDLAFHQIIETYSGTDLNIIYYDGNKNLIYTQDAGVNRGFKTNRLILENFNPISDGKESVKSGLNIEWFNPDEININGRTTKLNWIPSIIDKLFINIVVGLVTSDKITFTAKFRGENVANILNSDIELTDNKNGNISFVFIPFSGLSYEISNFNKTLSNGVLKINSNSYLGCAKYRVTSIISVSNNETFGSGDNEIWGDGNNAIFGN